VSGIGPPEDGPPAATPREDATERRVREHRTATLLTDIDRSLTRDLTEEGIREGRHRATLHPEGEFSLAPGLFRDLTEEAIRKRRRVRAQRFEHNGGQEYRQPA